MAASPVNGVTLRGTLPVELAFVKFPKGYRTPPTGWRKTSVPAAMSARSFEVVEVGSRLSTIVRDDLLSSSVLLQLAFSHCSTTDKKVGFLQMHVKSLRILQLAAAAAGYTQCCWSLVLIRVLKQAL